MTGLALVASAVHVDAVARWHRAGKLFRSGDGPSQIQPAAKIGDGSGDQLIAARLPLAYLITPVIGLVSETQRPPLTWSISTISGPA